jgi:MarR-like DNA-binding transcriptional regulator SgrR of sgrS sRNA
MAKQSLPSVDKDDASMILTQANEMPTAMGQEQREQNKLVEDSSLSLRPYACIDTRLTKASHRRRFRDKLNQLIDDNETLEDGTPVSHKTDVLKWFLENCV